MKIFSTKEAAVYLGLTLGGIRWHIYHSKLLQGRLMGGSLMFTQGELDMFKAVNKGREDNRVTK